MTDRIKTIASEIPICDTVCDVGCDHGYVAYLAKTLGLCKRVILTDISRGSLKKAEDLFFENRIEYKSYLTYGMVGVEEDIDTAVICGMGGHEIADIIKQRKVKNLILQPMLDERMLRVFLSENGYRIVKDYIFLSGGKFYNLIVATYGKCKLTKKQIYFGENIKNMSADFLKYVEHRKTVVEKILENSLPDPKKNELVYELKIMGEIQKNAYIRRD